MSGEEAPFAIEGDTYRSPVGDTLTVEPTNPGDRVVHMWTRVAREEQLGINLGPNVLRRLATSLLERADLLDPASSPVEIQWCAFHGGPDPENCAGSEVFHDDGEAEAGEAAEWLLESGTARRTVTYGPWEVVSSGCNPLPATQEAAES